MANLRPKLDRESGGFLLSLFFFIFFNLPIDKVQKISIM
nr:MAG TPA: hypothetical protein [Caudoviricetes sp.]